MPVSSTSGLQLISTMIRAFVTQGRSFIASYSRFSTGSLHSPQRTLAQNVPQDTLSQGHATRKSGSAVDVQAEHVKSGMKGEKGELDAASPNRDLRARLLEREDTKSGNPEGVGFAEQVGGQSASADAYAAGARSATREEHKGEAAATAAPSLFFTFRRTLALGSDAVRAAEIHEGYV